MATFTFGTDPEFVLMNKEIAYSAIAIVKAHKDKKKKVGDCEFFYDNVLAECSIPPASSKEEAVANIGDCLQKYANIVKPYKLVARASHTFTEDQLTHPDAKKIGCSRENCAYSLREIEPDEEIFEKTNLRSAGGHIHLGSDVLFIDYNVLTAIRLMDLFLGVPAIYIDHDPTSKTRKDLYGKAGRFRRPTYGLEYRSIGNFWLASPKLVELMYDLCDFVLTFLENNRAAELWDIDSVTLNSSEAWSDRNFDPASCHKCSGYDVKALRKCVDKMDKKNGKPFMDLIQRYLPAQLFERIQEASNPIQYDLYKEWNLK